MREGASETNAPLPNPKSAAKTIMGALAAAGSHSARTTIAAREQGQNGVVQREGCGERTCEYGHDDHHVETTDFIRKISGYRSSEQGASVQDWNEVLCKTVAHTEVLGLRDDVVDWQEHAQEEEKRSQTCQVERKLFEWSDEFHNVQRCGIRWHTGGDREIGDGEHEENEECRTSHGPGKSNVGDQSLYHDREDDSSHRRASSDDPKSKGSLLKEPRRHRAHGRIKYHARTNAGAQPLCEEELVVLRGQRSHHQTEDFQKGPDNEQISRAVVVVDFPDGGSEEEHGEDLEGADP